MLREFIPKGVTLRPLSYPHLLAVTNTINDRPRKIMDYATPAEHLQEELAVLQAASLLLLTQPTYPLGAEPPTIHQKNGKG